MHPDIAALSERRTSTDTSTDDVWVVVRCYNEAPVVQAVVRELKRTFPHVVAVDDGSTDGSAHLMSAAGAWVVRHDVNLGPGAALQTGVEFSLRDARCRYIVCFDGDGQHRVGDAQAMVARMRVEDLGVLVGSRFLGTSSHMPRIRRLVLLLARHYERVTSGVRLTDGHNGLRVFRRDVAERLHLRMPGMAYASELLDFIAHCGCSYAEHPVTIDYTPHSLAKGQRSLNSVNIALDVWVTRLLRGGNT